MKLDTGLSTRNLRDVPAAARAADADFRLTEVRRGCARKNIDYRMIHTEDYMDAALSKFLHHREALAKAPAKAQAPS